MPANLTIKTKGKIKVSEGEVVSQGQVLAEEEYIPQLLSLNVAKFLSVSPKKCLKFLTKKPGDKIKVSETIAKKKNFLGLKKKIIKAPCDGIVERLEAETGELIISLPKEKKTLLSPVFGKIKKIAENEITILVKGAEILLEETAGSFAKGELTVISGPEVDLFSLGEDLSGEIVAGKKWKQASIEKAIALSVKAILMTEVPGDFDWEEYRAPKLIFLGDCQGKISPNLGLVKGEDFGVFEENKGKMAIFDGKNKKVIIMTNF